jgi:CubicO group peptidase (beta-lactamase class C family)
MKAKLLLLLGSSFSLVCGGIGEQSQSTAGPAPNPDPDRVKAIVEAQAQKLGSKAVLFGMWVGDREILTMALGHSMTTVPASTDMHFRIGGIAETFMSTLLLDAGRAGTHQA